MAHTLIALHGFTQNGAAMRSALDPLSPKLPADLTVVCPDAPHPCSPTSIERMQRLLGEPLPPPQLCWFDASDDGLIYRGLDATIAQLDALARKTAPGDRVGLLGFSQGAILTLCLAALSAHERFAPLDYVIVVAGRKPRAEAITGLLDAELSIPALLLCGERDRLAIDQLDTLAACFAPSTCQVARWPGPHVVPTHGPGADALLQFIHARHVTGENLLNA